MTVPISTLTAQEIVDEILASRPGLTCFVQNHGTLVTVLVGSIVICWFQRRSRASRLPYPGQWGCNFPIEDPGGIVNPIGTTRQARDAAERVIAAIVRRLEQGP